MKRDRTWWCISYHLRPLGEGMVHSVLGFSSLFIYSNKFIGNFHKLQSSTILAELESHYGYHSFLKCVFHPWAWLCVFHLHNLDIQVPDLLSNPSKDFGAPVWVWPTSLNIKVIQVKPFYSKVFQHSATTTGSGRNRKFIKHIYFIEPLNMT